MGGMRNPRKAVMRLPTWQTWGETANRVLDEVARAEPDFGEVARSLGVEMTPEEAEASQQRLQRLGTKAANALGSRLKCQQWDDKGPTGWRWRLIRDITIAAQDPDVDVAQWFRGYTPLGINRPIVARGVFPWADTTKAQEASAEFLAALNGYHKVDRNYSSFHENLRDSSAGHCFPVARSKGYQAGHLGQNPTGWIPQGPLHCRYAPVRSQWLDLCRGKDSTSERNGPHQGCAGSHGIQRCGC